MSASSSPPTGSTARTELPAPVAQALAALATYERGSPRSALLALDEAVAASQADQSRRPELERRLVAALKASESEVARDYICVKLALIGSEAGVPALADLLSHPRLAAIARTALEAIPSETAGKALRDRLGKLDGLAKVGAITSLGARRDAGSTRALTSLLKRADEQVQAAAVTALGAIGSEKAGKALKAFLPKAPEPLRPKTADAMLRCAERLAAGGKKADAQALYLALASSKPPKHIADAASRGVRACQESGSARS